MKRISSSKEPNTKQMQAMAENLHEKFKVCVTVEVCAWAYYTNHLATQYGIYLDLDQKPTVKFSAWSEVLAFYRKLMKGGKEVWLEAKNAS